MSVALDPAPLSFTTLGMEDLPLLHRWLNTPHVLAWWDRDMTMEQVVAKYAPRILEEASVHGFLIRYAGRPIGFIQWYRIGDDPAYAEALALGIDAVGADLYVGEADLVHRGLGGAALARFLLDIAFPQSGLDVCVIGPSERNAAAIRAYEKVGFRRLRTVRVPGEDDPELLLIARRGDLRLSGGSAPRR